MSGPLPKDPKLLQRRNKTSTRATLTDDGKRRKARPLPKHREWHPLTRAWWRDVWQSPMAGEYVKADIHGLYRLLELVERFWRKPSISLSAEIRQLGMCYGLSPIDRRRLQWEVERLEKRRRPTPRSFGAGDPRDALKVLEGGIS